MPRVVVFESVTLDGYFTDSKNDMSWAHTRDNDPEWNDFTAENAKSGGVLVFGRKTYELMVSFWPTPAAQKMNPTVAERMNALPKVVFSRTLDKATWNNTKLVKSDPAATVRQMKRDPGPDLVILGSGSIVSQLTQEGLVDEYQFVLTPIALGKGRTLFDGVQKKLPLKLGKTRTFKNGNILLTYQPAPAG